MQVEIVLFNDITNQVPFKPRQRIISRLSEIIGFLGTQYKVTTSNNLEKIIKESSAEYVLVISLGNYFDGVEAIEEMVEYAIEQKTPLVAHILHQTSVFQIHPQWFMIKTSVYKKLGCPPIVPQNIDSRSLLMVPNRSRENVHDNYTPLWVTPSKSYAMQTVPGHFFGTYLLDSILNAGYTIKNVPQNVRYKKTYCYPNENWQEIIQCLDDKNYQPVNANVEKFVNIFKKSINNVFNDKGYYPINSEKIPPINNNQPIFKDKTYNFFAGVCGGIKPALITGADNFDKDSTVVLFDASQAALDWQIYIYDNWDGVPENFEILAKKFKKDNPEYTELFNHHNNYLDILEENLSSAEIDYKELKRRWDKFKDYNVEFLKINLLEETSIKELCKMLEDSQTRAYIWFSNSFDMDWQRFYFGSNYMKYKLQEVLDIIKNNTSASLVLEECTHLRLIR